MSRIVFEQVSPEFFLKEIKSSTGFSYERLAKLCNVHRRSFSDWANKKSLMPDLVFNKLLPISKVKPNYKIIADHWHKKDAGKKGALARKKTYGNPGTPEGRRRGGINSYKKFLENPKLAKEKGFLLAKQINHPHFSTKLTELIGIILGDGGITNYQIRITLNRVDDYEYSQHVIKLVENLFKFTPAFYEREMTVQIVISRVNAVNFLLKHHLLIGNKVKHQVAVPDWIRDSRVYTKACMRGLFDTDGCFYIDKHKYKNKIYKHCAMNFTNRSLPLLEFFKAGLKMIGLHPTQKTSFAIFLRRKDEIYKYFNEIGSSNPKHINKFNLYFKTGEVPKWS